MLSYNHTQIIKRLIHHKACISVASGCDAFPAHPHSDRRKRPAFWVPIDDMRALKASGAIELGTSGYVVTESVKRRLSNGREEQAANQHYALQEKEVYVHGGSKRSARVNTRLSALDRLAHRTDIEGRPVLDNSLIEAGKHFARDYHASGHGLSTTQKYDNVSVDSSGASQNSVEDHYARTADAKARLRKARESMGSGLDIAVIAVCCLDQSLDVVERAEAWAKGSGLTLLKMGLARLADHYGTVAGPRSHFHD